MPAVLSCRSDPHDPRRRQGERQGTWTSGTCPRKPRQKPKGVANESDQPHRSGGLRRMRRVPPGRRLPVGGASPRPARLASPSPEPVQRSLDRSSADPSSGPGHGRDENQRRDRPDPAGDIRRLPRDGSAGRRDDFQRSRAGNPDLRRARRSIRAAKSPHAPPVGSRERDARSFYPRRARHVGFRGAPRPRGGARSSSRGRPPARPEAPNGSQHEPIDEKRPVGSRPRRRGLPEARHRASSERKDERRAGTSGVFF